MSRAPLTIRPVQGVQEFQACQAVQRRAWQIREEGYLLPLATMVGVQGHGGLVLGAWQDGQLVGFSFGFLGRKRGRVMLFSQMTGVLPEAQGQGVGLALKRAQRAWAADHGLSQIAWAFDPLQAGNANFNLMHLGAYSCTYEPNLYGLRSDGVNPGLPTDRLEAEWPVQAWIRPALPTLSVCTPLLRTRLVHDLRVAEGLAYEGSPVFDGPLSLEIPFSVRALAARDYAETVHWQDLTRQAFTAAFAAGYTALGFSRGPVDAGTACEPRAFYLLLRFEADEGQSNA